MNIANTTLQYVPLVHGQNTKEVPNYKKWNAKTQVRVIQEDCLGNCHNRHADWSESGRSD